MNLRLPLILVASFVLMSLAPPAARACGTPEPDAVLAGYYRGLAAHDRARILAEWAPNATVVSGNPATIEPVERAATRWATSKKPVTFHIEKIERGESTAIAFVSVRFDGHDVEDTVLLTEVPNLPGEWRIAGKSSRQTDYGTPAIRY